MKAFGFAVLIIVLAARQAFAWGQEGHSIVAEVAQREVKPTTRAAIDKILHHGTLAAVASWADDAKFTTRPDTATWHFVDIPLDQDKYDPKNCIDKKDPSKGNTCLIYALEKLKGELSCAKDEKTRLDDLRFVVHLIGDSTQPLHTVDDLVGGNLLIVKAGFCGLRDPRCTPPTDPPSVKFHELWDSTLITETFYDWGGYVDRLYDPEKGWLNSAEAHKGDPAGSSVVDWVNDTHAQAQVVWRKLLPPDKVINQSYYDTVLPIVDRQLGIGGLRLARYLDATLGRGACHARRASGK